MLFRRLVVLLLVTLFAFAASGVASAADPPKPVERCRPTDKRLEELSGLASDGERWYAHPDGGTKLQVFVLRSKDCSVEKVITNPTDPFDVEDMARAADGTLWLADTGDNKHARENVALHALSPNGQAKLYRLTYPDGAHDCEALLLDRKGVPYLVTKEPLGGAAVYRPAKPLAAPGPTPLEKVGTVTIKSTDTPGGPIGAGIGSVLVTGGAVNADGTVVALRTYTDAHLYSAPDGDIAAALQREPVRIPLPNEKQGEAIAFEPDGTLLSGSEKLEPIRAVPGAAALAKSAAPAKSETGGAGAGSSGTEASAKPEQGSGLSTLSAIAIAGLGALVLVAILSRSRKARR